MCGARKAAQDHFCTITAVKCYRPFLLAARIMIVGDDGAIWLVAITHPRVHFMQQRTPPPFANLMVTLPLAILSVSNSVLHTQPAL